MSHCEVCKKEFRAFNGARCCSPRCARKLWIREGGEAEGDAKIARIMKSRRKRPLASIANASQVLREAKRKGELN